MTPAQNRALRSVLLSHIRHLDRFIMYIETAPGVGLKDTVYEGIRTHTSYIRATLRMTVQQLEDQHERDNPNPTPRRRPSIPQPPRVHPHHDLQEEEGS